MNESIEFVQLLAAIDHIDYGQVEFTPKYRSVGFHVWFCEGGTEDEERNADDLIRVLFGTGFEVERHTSIGHTTFLGLWNGLQVEVRTGPGVFCQRVQVGERVIPAKPAVVERVEPVYEWVCADGLAAS